jgi:eukaryotic-like serine/threonine-protein kinase
VKLIRDELAADREFRVRFAREVAAARHVSGMFTAPVVDADLDAPRPWLVTGYVPGPSLAEAVDSQGPLPLSSVLTLAAGLAEGLGAIHAGGMVHRDLKPSNVLLASDGPRIIDFGISRAADATALTQANFFVGSPGYMSPEQALGDEVGPASDIFSLGAVLTFAAVGEGPFGIGTVTALMYRVAHDRPATKRLPGQLRPLVERCLAKDPRTRPTTDQLLTELGTVDSGTNWLPRPVAETLAEYAAPAVDTTIPPAQAPRVPAPPPGPPSGNVYDALYRREPAPKRPDTSHVPSTTTPLGWRSDFARPPRRRRRLRGVLAAAALLLVLAAAGVAALVLTSRVQLGGQPEPPASSPAAASPQAVVRAYFAAINAHQWRKVWNLGGKNFGRTYDQMVAGYSSTARDVLTSVHGHGRVVTVRLRAHQTDGTVRTYRITYTVRDGVITRAHTTLLRTS